MSETVMMAANRYRLRSLANPGQPGRRTRPRPARPHRPPAGRHPAVQQPGQHGRRHAGQRDHARALRQRELGARRGDPASVHLRDPGVLRDHAQGRRRQPRRPSRPSSTYPLTRPAARVVFRGVVHQPVLARAAPACCVCRTKEDPAGAVRRRLRAMVIESGQYIPHKHRSILLNLFDLESITVGT